MNRLDKEALTYAYEKITKGPDKEAARRLKQMAAEDGWTAAAERAASHLQVDALGLRPWELPPCRARPGGKEPESRLLDKLIAQGFSRYTADPTVVLVGFRAETRGKHRSDTLGAA
jgi:hypothetical protein